ncbi:hypothetical protein TQ33_2180 [Kangiella geojedonensis]|uniref:Uncharacterized protein n=1 Tax=Kangiella geojedonensis TaxID=914150 RepID=A0A0F6RDN3_9GAMM|nr:hypothetical protein TQ33_2180 [Kangiella geojedonensis]
MGYYKNSFKASASSESTELSNFRGWIIIAGLAFAVLSLFTLGNENVKEGLSGFLTAGVMIFIGTAISFLCDKHVLGRVFFLLTVLCAMSGLIFYSVHQATFEHFIFMVLGLTYLLGALWFLSKYHLSLD